MHFMISFSLSLKPFGILKHVSNAVKSDIYCRKTFYTRFWEKLYCPKNLWKYIFPNINAYWILSVLFQGKLHIKTPRNWVTNFIGFNDLGHNSLYKIIYPPCVFCNIYKAPVQYYFSPQTKKYVNSFASNTTLVGCEQHKSFLFSLSEGKIGLIKTRLCFTSREGQEKRYERDRVSKSVC